MKNSLVILLSTIGFTLFIIAIVSSYSLYYDHFYPTVTSTISAIGCSIILGSILLDLFGKLLQIKADSLVKPIPFDTHDLEEISISSQHIHIDWTYHSGVYF